jgi:hypothetical protein
MLTETKLTKAFKAKDLQCHQTAYKRNGGCLTASTLVGHKRVKQLGTYLSWTKVPIGNEEI